VAFDALGSDFLQPGFAPAPGSAHRLRANRTFVVVTRCKCYAEVQFWGWVGRVVVTQYGIDAGLVRNGDG
jgi:hypothetical protein